MDLNFIESTIKGGVVLATPQLAEKLLASSAGNRKISKNRVHAYASDIMMGHWHLNGETVVLDEHGHLRDGHHRCLAIIEANTSAPLYIITNVPVEDAKIYDQGRLRSYADEFKLNEKGIIFNNGSVAVARFHYMMVHNIEFISLPTAEAFIEKHKDSLILIRDIIKHGITRKTPVYYALFAALLCGVHKEVLSDFAECVNNGIIKSPSQSSAQKLREFLLTSHIASKTHRIEACYIAENAIRDFASGAVRIKSYSVNSKPVYSNQKNVLLA